MRNRELGKIGAIGIVLIFVFGAFAPAIGSKSDSRNKILATNAIDEEKSFFEDQNILQLNDSDLQINDESDLNSDEIQYDIIQKNDTLEGEVAPLDTPSTFYESVGKVYKKPTTYAELVSWYQNLEQNYSGYIQVFKANELYNTGVIPKTGGGSYDLYYVRVTNESLGFHKPEVFFSGQAHGNEKVGAIGLYWTLDWLIRHAFHPDYNCAEREYLQWLLDNREIYIEISHNPDGFDRDVRGDYLNRDLNREADHDASYGPFDSVNGKTIMSFFNNHTIRTAIWYHTGTRALLYPWQNEHSSITGVSPISGTSYGHVPADFFFYDAAGLLLGDYIGDYGGNLGPNQIGSSYTIGQGGPGCLDSWAYGGNDVKNPAEDSYVELGPHLGAGVFAWDPEAYGTGSPAQSTFGNDTTNRLGAEVRRTFMYMTDLAQPSVHWTNGTTEDYMEIDMGETLDFSWLVNGCLVVDNTRIQYGTNPDPINNPLYFTTNIDDHNGDYYGGSYWDDALDGSSTPTNYHEEIIFNTPGDYFIVAKAMVDQKYADVLRSDHYGSNSYLRMINERTDGSFTESLTGTDGLEEINGQLWWYSPVIHVRVKEIGMTWFNTSWAYRKEIIVNHSMVDEDLSAFPILVNITDTDLASKAQINGNDILFTDSFNNKLDHEIEYYADGHLIAWVNVPVLLSTLDTNLYMYYGNSTCGSQQNVGGVWDSHYMMVQHLSETTGTHYDSTGNNNDGTPYGGINQDATGQIDGTDDFDGSNDYVQIPHNNTISGFTQGLTASAWIRTDGNSSWVTILNKYNTSNNQRGWQVYYDGSENPKRLHFVLATSSTIYTSYMINFNAAINSWYYIEATWTSGQVPTIYVNGVAFTPTPTTTISSIYNNPLEPLYIGRAYIGGTSDGRFFNGIIDEVRISNIARSEAWIKTSYNNQVNPSGFITLGGQKGPMFVFNPSPGINSQDVPRSTSTLNFNITHLQGKPMDYTVQTSPNIGSAVGNGVYDGRYAVSISGLDDCTTYVWYVNVTDGTDSVSERFEFTTVCQDPWWDANWHYRKKITIDSNMIPADLTDFPVLLNFFDSDVANKAQADGDDIVFTDKNGVQLNHEIEKFHSSTLTAWVKIPTLLSSQDTYIYMYYGNAITENQQNPSGVWDSNYMMVQHLSEASGTHYDSTINDNDGSPMNGVVQNAIGKIDGADQFDGTNDYVEVPHDDTLAGFTEAMTASVWVKFNDLSSRQAILNKYDSTGNQRSWALDFELEDGTELGFIGSTSPGSTFVAYLYDSLIVSETWYYVTVVWQANQVPKMYVNGVQLSTTETATLSSLYNNPSEPLFLGQAYSTVSPERNLNGVIDEVQISNVTRSVAWITASYRNQDNPFNFIVLGAEESEHPLISDPLPSNGETNVAILDNQLSFHLNDRQDNAMNYTVETSPDIGSDSANNVYNGRYYVSISGLAYETTYTWFVNATDGEHESQQIFTFSTVRAPIPWWNANWSFRKEVILDHTKVAEDFYNYPMLVTFNDSDIRVKARKDGNDIVFADASGYKLDYEIEYYLKGKLEAWVRIPYLSSTVDTSIMVYYGNYDAENQENPAGVWDSHYMMVQHLSEISGTHYDSTSNDNDGSPYGGVVQKAIGQIDGADEFDGTNDYLQVPHDSTLSGFTEGMTASAWVKFDTTGARKAIVGKYATTGNQRSWNLEYITSPVRALQLTASSNGTSVYSYWYADVGTLATGTWYHVAVGWHPNELPTLYLNGNKLSITLSSGVNLTQIYNNVNTPLYIGRTYTTDRYWDGSIDEVRISNITRSAAWIKTCYNNQLNPLAFYSMSSEEIGIAPSEPFLYDEDPLDESSIVPLNPTLSIGVLDYQDDTIDVTFRTNASSGTWVTIGSYTNGFSATYTQVTSTMNNYFTNYYWSVNCTDTYNHWNNKTYSFTTRKANYPPALTNPSPSNGSTGVAPIPSLSITMDDIDENLLTVLFKSNYSGSWQTLESLNNIPSGTYSILPDGMSAKGKTYYWSVHCYDGIVWANQTYHFTMSSTLLTLKWTSTYSPIGNGMLVTGDINGDDIDEIFIPGSMSYCIDGKTGSVIWQKAVSGGTGQGLMADCNGDGILDLIVPIAASGIEVLYGNNGTTYWRRTGLGGSSMCKPVAFDINGDGCSEVFYASQDITNGWNGTGRVTSLTHDGKIVNQIFAYRPCGGGLSLADTNFDGQFELYMGDRHQSYSGDGGVPRGLRAFLIDEDGTIHCNWNRSDILMSSHAPIIADVNGDGKLDIVCCHQAGGIFVIDSTTGATIKGAYRIYASDGFPFPGHYQMTVCDVDGDGHLELLAADGTHPEPYTTDEVAVWDLVTWQEEALLTGICEYGPTTGDVTGDGLPDILIASFTGLHIYTWNQTSDSAQLLEERNGLSGTLGPAVLADVDGDGYNELIIGGTSGRIYVYDVPAPSPTPRPLSEIQFYSTYRNGQAIYTEPPGIPRPLVKDVFPVNKSVNIDVMPSLSFKVIDYQHDPITITVRTNASGSWTDFASYTNMKTGKTYSVPCPSMNVPGTTYYWRVIATDGIHTTTETFHLTTYSPGPFKPGWEYRRKIVLNQSQIQADLENFPVLIDITDAEIGQKTKPNGDDLLFTAVDGTTILDYEIEYYNNSDGHLVAWVTTNIAATNGTFIYLYYGNASATNHENPEGVWDSHYRMVQHLSETSGTIYDSTIHHNNGTPLNGAVQNTIGKIDGADEFDGVNDYITVPHNNSLAGFTEGLTGSAWFKLDTVSRRQAILCKYNTVSNQRGYYLDFVNSPASFQLYASSDGVTGVYWIAAYTAVAGSWYHIAFTWAPNTIPKIYVNGQRLTVTRTDLLSTIYNNAVEPLRLGNSYTTGRQIDGKLDEIQISDIARSEEWIQTCYNNQVDPSSFYEMSTELTRYNLTVSTSGNGTGTVEVSPAGPYYPEQVVTLWANASEGSVFTGWSGDATGTTTPFSLVVNSNKNVNAEFTYGLHSLTLSTSPALAGSILKDPDQVAYSHGQDVELTAVPNPEWTFMHWSGDLTGTENPSTITITDNMAVTAVFEPILYDDIVFNSSFDQGNLINVQYQSGNSTGYRYYTAKNNYTTVSYADKHWWFYYSMENVAGKTIKVQLQNLESVDFTGNRWTEIEPVYSYDNLNWQRLPLSNVVADGTALTFTITVTPTNNKIWLAPIPPYPVWRRDALFNEFSTSPYLTVSSLGTTPGGQELKIATITDHAYNDSNKFKAYAIAQQHAGEIPGSWNAEGMIRFLLSNDSTAQAIRRSYIFKIIPITNVDGVYKGVSRYTPLRSGVQYDLNREWNKNIASMQPEIQWILQDIISWQPDCFNDLHSTINTEVTSPKEALTYTWDYTNQTVVNFMDKIHLGGYPETVRGNTGSTNACPQVKTRTGLLESISWENPNDELSTNPGVKLTTNDWMNWGKGFPKGVYLYFGNASGKLTTSVVGSGSITKNPDQTTYTYGATVQLTAIPTLGWTFYQWSGDLTGTDNPLNITIDSNKTVTATFQDAIPPQISNVQAIPASTAQGGSVNITCDVSDNIMVDTVKVDISGPAGFVPVNVTMETGSYHYNSSYNFVGTYDFFIWANDTQGNSNISASYTFEITGEAGWDVQFDVSASSEVNDMVVFGEAPDASDGVDGYDIPKPGMPPTPCVYARFTTSLPDPYDTLWEEYQHYPGNAKTWNLSILWSDEGTGYVNITWDPLKVSNSEYTYMRLHDLDLDTWTDMHSLSYYNYTATSDINRHFQIVCTSTMPEYNHEIIIHEEWNMISVCFNESYAKTDITVEYLGVNHTWSEAVAEGILVPVFYGWDADIQNYAESDVLEPGRSYWLYSYENCSLWIRGQANAKNVIQTLQPAWNFVGCPFDEAIDIQDLIIRYNTVPYSWGDAVTAGIIMNTVFYWDVTIDNYNIATAITADQGYWMYAYQTCILERGS